jgi:hypothetical protein
VGGNDEAGKGDAGAAGRPKLAEAEAELREAGFDVEAEREKETK